MHWHTWKFLLNTLGRAVEQLAGCLAKQAEVTGRGQRVNLKCIMNIIPVSNRVNLVRESGFATSTGDETTQIYHAKGGSKQFLRYPPSPIATSSIVLQIFG